MNTPIQDGGPAYPRVGMQYKDASGLPLAASSGYGWELEPQNGMSLRDHLASQALAGICANPSVHAPNPMSGWICLPFGRRNDICSHGMPPRETARKLHSLQTE